MTKIMRLKLINLFLCVLGGGGKKMLREKEKMLATQKLQLDGEVELRYFFLNDQKSNVTLSFH